MRLKLTFAYDGIGFRGWAAQPGLRTVEGEVRRALDSTFRSWSGLAVAGRTDAGVHAFANVASVEVEGGPPAARVAEALNAALPDDVAVAAADEAPPEFHARFSARSRSYLYRIWRARRRSPFERDRSWWQPRPLDVARAGGAGRAPRRRHDWRAFTPTETQHQTFTRVVESARWVEGGEVLAFEITADSFLRHMVRTLVGTMVDGVGSRAAPRGPAAQPGGPDGAAGGLVPRRRCLRLSACASRSSSSISTARWSTPARSSSARSTMRRETVLQRRFPDEQILAQVGGSNLVAQMQLLAPDRVDELVRVYRDAQRPAVLRPRVLRGDGRRARHA